MMKMMWAFQANMEAQTQALQAHAEADRNGRDQHAPPPKIEQPATFSGTKGKDESDLKTFLGQGNNQLRVDPRAFATDGAKVGFAISLLRGRAGEVVVSLSADESRQDVVGSCEKFNEYLDLTFGDPNRKNAARQSLHKFDQVGIRCAVEGLAGILGWTSKETQVVLVGTGGEGSEGESADGDCEERKDIRHGEGETETFRDFGSKLDKS